MDEAPSGRSSPTSTGRSSPTNDASDDPAAAISRIASLFQSLNRLRDAGYGASVIAAKVAECRAAVVSLPPDLQAQVMALVNAIDDELEGDGAAPVDDVDEIPFGLLDLPPPVLALCCVFAGDSGSLVPRLAHTCRAGGEVKPAIMQSLYAVGTRVVLHGLQADTLNLRRGTVVQCATAEDRVGVRLDGEVKPKSVRRVNVRLERGPHESGEPDELHEGFWCDGCGHFRGNDSPPSKSLRGTRYRCTRCAAIPGFDLCSRCFGAGFAHACSATPALSHENKTDCGPKEFDAAGFKALKDSQATSFAKWVETAAAEGELEERELVRQAMNFGDERGPRSAAVVNTIYRAQFPQGGAAGLKKLRGALMREEIDAQIRAAMANAGMGPQPEGAVPPVGPFGGQGPVQFGGIRVEGPGGVAMPQGLQAAAAQFGAQVAAGGGELPFNIADVMGAQFGNFGFPLPTPGAAAAPDAGDDEASETPTVVEDAHAEESEAAVEPHLTEAPLEVAFNAAPAEPPVTGGGAPNIRRQRGRGLGDLISPDPEVRARAIAATTGDHTYDASRAPRWDDDGNPLT